MIPRTLAEWNLDKIRELLVNRYAEQETFDWKEMLPHKNDDGGKRRLRKDCCAFSNSSGGFLVFGVSDDATRGVEDRLVGFDQHYEFMVDFGNYPSACRPSSHWEPKNPPITLPNGKVLHVVWFPRSWNGPHSVGDAESGFVFPKRTNRGTEHMSYEEVRMGFLGYYEKRLKLQLLHAELKNMHADAEHVMLPEGQWQQAVPIVTLNISVIEQILVDTFSILADHSELLRMLTWIRGAARTLNTRLELCRGIAHIPISNQGSVLRDHNQQLCQQSVALRKDLDSALTLLESFLAKA